MRGYRRAAVLAAVVLALGFAVARADGEAGLVIQHGDGSIDTYCVPFSGDSISGKELLRRVNIPVEDFGGLVCAVGNDANEGCFGASSFDSCTCKCSGSNAATCTYWAYFTAPYGQPWAYSSLGFAGVKSKDGDLQAWRWGRGGPSSAPAPPAISFESVCGHAPRGGVAPPTAPPPTSTLAAVLSPTTAAPPTSSASSALTPELTASVTVTEQPPTATAESASPTVLVTITSHGTATATASAAPAVKGDGGGGAKGLLGFAAVALVLLAAIGGAVIWRQRNGG